ncbi:MAG: hypothetical protein KBD66_04325 [Candidatus Doudnabacteria bacterium]|nr:hypothetical protein [Candidatus Doudnabacteria bacterium]
MQRQNSKSLYQQGYIALFTLLGLALLLTGASTVLLLAMTLGQESTLAVQQVEQVRSLARGCGRILEYAMQIDWPQARVGERLNIAEVGECTVLADEVLGGGARQMDVRAQSADMVVDMRLVLDEFTKEIRAQSESP